MRRGIAVGWRTSFSTGTDVPVVAEPDDVGALWSACLGALGVRRAFAAPGHGFPYPDGIEVVEVPTEEIARVLADADGRSMTGSEARPGLALLTDGLVRLTSQPGSMPLEPSLVTDATALPMVVAGWDFGRVHAAVEFVLDLDPAAPVPPGVVPMALEESDRLMRLSDSLAPFDIVLVIGPGVVRAGRVAEVAEAAQRTGAGVVATMNAFGVLPVDHPSWRGVVGLQADDPVGSAVAGAELVILAGVDPEETVSVVPSDAQVLEVEPWHLGLMAHHWPDPVTDPTATGARRGLVTALAELVERARRDPALPLHPVRAVVDLAEAMGPDGVIAVDPGPAGLWLGRGLVDRPAGSVQIPAKAIRGFAAARAVIAGLDGDRCVAVTTAPTDPLTDALVDLAATLDVPLVLAQWGAGAAWESADEYGERLRQVIGQPGVHRLGVPVDLARTRELVELSGPVVAWIPVDEDPSFS